MSKAVRKAVLPVAGLGTRMLPATKAIPKEMLTIIDKPLIQYVVDEAVSAGIKEIVLVTHASKNSIENHFDTSFELEAQLEKRVKRQLLEEVRSIVPEDVTIISVRQPKAKGLGHAIACARPVVGDEPFAVLLPDVLVNKFDCDLTKDNLATMINNFNTSGASQILVAPVPWEDVGSYGVVDCEGEELAPGEKARIANIIEKPKIEEAPSNLTVVGRYVLSATIWDLFDKTLPGAGGEIQLTDAIDMLIERETVEALHIVGRSHDCGNKLGFIRAKMAYSLHHREVGKYVKQVVTEEIEHAETHHSNIFD